MSGERVFQVDYLTAQPDYTEGGLGEILATNSEALFGGGIRFVHYVNKGGGDIALGIKAKYEQALERPDVIIVEKPKLTYGDVIGLGAVRRNIGDTLLVVITANQGVSSMQVELGGLVVIDASGIDTQDVEAFARSISEKIGYVPAA